MPCGVVNSPGPLPRPPPAREVRTVGTEAVDHGVAVAVGDEEVAVRPDCDIGRVVEGRLGPGAVPFAERQQQLAFAVEDEHLVRVPIYHQDAAVRGDSDPVRVRNLPVAPASDEVPLGIEHQHRGRAPLADMEIAVRIDRAFADDPDRNVLRPAAPGPVDPVALLAQHGKQIAVVHVHVRLLAARGRAVQASGSTQPVQLRRMASHSAVRTPVTTSIERRVSSSSASTL